MDVSYSAWRQVTEESRVLGGESFSFLFDRRYTNRLNRMSRVFFEAYIKATKEVSAEEDRFPSLSEIESRMESGAIYAYKDRLMRSTEFFEEVKVSGISYLIPKAIRFVDETGTYTDLVLDFEESVVTLPKRRKAPLVSDEEVEEEAGPEEEGVEETIGREEVSGEDEDLTEVLTEIEPEYPVETPEATPEVTPKAAPEVMVEPEEAEPEKEDVSVISPEPEKKVREAAPEPSKPQDKKPKKWAIDTRVASAAIAALIVVSLLAIHLWIPSGTVPPADSASKPNSVSESVQYAAYLCNESGDTYLKVDITNPSGLDSMVEMVIPPDVEQSISAMGGAVTMSYANDTVIRLDFNNDANISVRLIEDLEEVPVGFNLEVPPNFDSDLLVYEEYQSVRKEDTIVLMCNCTENVLRFEQVYNEKEVSGPGGAQEVSPENVTEGG